MIFFFPYHLVSVSPWPLLMSLSVVLLMISILIMFNEYNFMMIFFSMLLLLLMMYQWWRDVVRESTYQGNHSINVVKGLQIGMLLFIFSEVMFFVSFFWTYFHFMLSPSVDLGGYCPPFMIEPFNPYNIPLLNTVILLTSGVTITLCHHSFLNNKFNFSLLMIISTLFLGITFTIFQLIEYNECSFTISDSMYGSIFFLATGFHGIHVLIGFFFIFIMLIRLMKKQFSYFHHFGFEGCLWYWHFVDVVWLYLYIFMYWLIY